jgi:arsenate reductase-like glutaredoxin family protein
MTRQPAPVTIYHNPSCGTSRNTLALIRNAGVEPTVIEYLIQDLADRHNFVIERMLQSTLRTEHETPSLGWLVVLRRS